MSEEIGKILSGRLRAILIRKKTYSIEFNGFSNIGIFIAFLTWPICLLLVMSESSCASSMSCGGFDLLIFGFLSIVYLVPSYFAGYFVSIFTPDE